MLSWPKNNIGKVFSYLNFSKALTLSVVIVVTLLILGFVVAPFAPVDPRRWGRVPRDRPPSLAHPLGTTTVGQDVFWLTARAIRNSFIFGGVAGGFSIVIALVMGFAGGYSKIFWSWLADQVINSFSVIPGLPYLLVLAYSVREHLNIVLLGLLLSTIGWAWPAKALRSMILAARERTHVQTAVASGLNPVRIFLSEILPYVLPWAATQFLNLMKWAIMMETTLGVFGLSSMEEATIGTMLYWAIQYHALLRGIWWWLLAPILVAVVIIAALYYVSMGVGELLNPKSRLARIRKAAWTR